MKKIIYLICLVFIFVSCVRTSEEPINWNEKSLPVVFSFITPDSTIKVLLTEISQNRNAVDTFPNAEVYIIDENNNQVLLTRLDSVTFADQERKMNIYAGKTYQLKINLKNGSSIITAHTTLPNVSANFEEYTVTPTNQSSEFQKSAYFKCEWKIPAQNNQTDGYFLLTSWYFGILQVVKKDAQTYTVNDNQLYYPADGNSYYISLLTTDKWMNRYLTNENAQSYSSGTKVDLFVLFLPEYLSTFPNFSNIENGIGVFGSYLIHTRDLEGNVVK